MGSRFYSRSAIVEFEGSDGALIRVGRLPLLARFEFRWRLNELLTIFQSVNESTSWDGLFSENSGFKIHCERCLELYEIPVSKISIDRLCWLLISAGEDRRGRLVELEFPDVPEKKDGGKKKKDSGPIFDDDIRADARVLASVWTHTGNLKEAIALASERDIPGDLLLEVLAAKNAIAEHANGSKKERQFKSAERHYKEAAKGKDAKLSGGKHRPQATRRSPNSSSNHSTPRSPPCLRLILKSSVVAMVRKE